MPTLFSMRVVPEAELADAMGWEFDAGWFPDTHRLSVGDGAGTVYASYIADPAAWCRVYDEPPPVAPGGGSFRTGVHLEPSRYYTGSAALAARVAAWLGERYGFRERPGPAFPFPAAAPAIQSPAEPASGH